MKRFPSPYPSASLLFGLSCLSANGAVSLTNSPNFADAPASRDAWLVDSGITSPQYLADFESGFSEEQNISGVTGLFSGGLVIRDTTPSNAAIIRTTGQIGSSNPVGNFAVTHNEGAFLVLDFSAAPVDYVAFRDIDSTSTSILLNFLGGGTETIAIDSTGASGDTAEFAGIFRNDQPRIVSVQLDADGDGTWGIDQIEYGTIPEPSSLACMLLALTCLTRRRRKFTASCGS